MNETSGQVSRCREVAVSRGSTVVKVAYRKLINT